MKPTCSLEEDGEAVEFGSVQVSPDKWIDLDFDEADVIAALHAAARERLPPGTRYELRKKTPSNYGRTKGIAWYRHVLMDREPTWDAVPPTFINEGGYYLMGRFVA